MIKLLALISVLILIACNASINESFYLNDGETKNGDILCINGSINIGNNCKVMGGCKAVNGSIKIGRNSIVGDIQSVNGPVSIENNSTIKGDITAVNGEIQTSDGVNVLGDVTSVNGNIILENTKVAKNVETENGDITLTESTVVEKDILIKGKSKWSDEKRRVEIRLERGAQVNGDINVKDEGIDVTIFLSSDSKIMGDVINAEIIYE
ncbi:MAG: hypothetical protein JW956_03040 [Calditrichaceae bacterium]|nr:hypothetical protein [Calditrichaceae bacterium]